MLRGGEARTHVLWPLLRVLFLVAFRREGVVGGKTRRRGWEGRGGVTICVQFDVRTGVELTAGFSRGRCGSSVLPGGVFAHGAGCRR